MLDWIYNFKKLPNCSGLVSQLLPKFDALKNLYIIAPYPKGKAPSQRFRFEQYIQEFEKTGFRIHFHSFLNEKTWKTIYKEQKTLTKVRGMIGSFLRRWGLLFQLGKADEILIHREAAQLGPPIFEWIIAKILRKKYIYDFDDAIWLPNFSESNARFHRLKAYWKVNYCIKWAGHVIAGNDYLADYARKLNPNVTVIPTTIDTLNYHNQSIDYQKTKLTIGWTGTHTTMRYLDAVIPIIQELEKKYSFEFIVISNEAPHFKLKSLCYIPWNKETEIEDLLRISIGVMPLVEDQWSSGKCGFKALQYMALGIPSILSPVGVNTKIVSSPEIGILATSPNEWRDALELLLTHPSLRETLGKAGKKQVLDYYSVLSQTTTYLSILQQSHI